MYLILESIINFEIGQTVRINPDNPMVGDKQGHNKIENANRCGKIIWIEEEKYLDYEGETKVRRTGKMGVKWEKAHRSAKAINYKNLIIV